MVFFAMKPKKPAIKESQKDLFRVELKKIIDLSHPLVKLADAVDWDRWEKTLETSYSPNKGRPGRSTRLMVALHYLKFTYRLSDMHVVAGWVENPYWQFFSGMKWFEHRKPVHPSSMSRWRKRIGHEAVELLSNQAIESI